MNYINKKLKEFVKNRKREIEEERQIEKLFHLEEIYKLGRKRQEKKRAVLNLKGKKLKEFDEVMLIRFGRSEPIETEIKEDEVVLIVDEFFYKLRKKSFQQFVRDAEKYPIWMVENVWKYFMDVWVNKPLYKFVLKEEVDIHLFVNDITFRRWLEALELLEKWKRQDLVNFFIFGNLPETNISADSQSDLVYAPSLDLNEFQISFVEKSLKFNHFLLLHWPFGTGKTTTLIWTILDNINQWKKLLVSADSNTAVDNILLRLKRYLEPGQMVRVGTFTKLVSQSDWDYSIYHLLEKHPKYEKIKQLEIEIEKLKQKQSQYKKPVPSIRRGLSDVQIHRLAAAWKTYRWLSLKTLWSMSNWLLIQKQIERLLTEKEEIKTKIINEIIKNAQVVLSTNSMCFSEYLKDKKFDIAIIDEGSQATFPSTLLSILLANKFIIAWDHKQLPPTVLNPNSKLLIKSLFETLIDLVYSNRYQDQYYHLLQIQYRMNEILMEFPNKYFYNWKLKAADEVKNITLADLIGEKAGKWIDSKKVLYWFDIKWKQILHWESKSLYNLEEIDLVGKIIKELFSLWVKPERIGVISPYSAQVNKLKEKYENLRVEINTVDGFQWREKEIIIISWVRTEKIWFLSDPRRLNVAITRPKRLLINVWNSKNLQSDKFFKEYLKFIKQKWEILQL